MTLTTRVRVKEAIQRIPFFWRSLVRIKKKIRSVRTLGYFFNDLYSVACWMRWSSKNEDQVSLSAELLFYYHKIEKGLVMPGERRLFGVEVVPVVMILMRRWVCAGYDQHNPIFQGALQTLTSYLNFLGQMNYHSSLDLKSAVESFLNEFRSFEDKLSTPIKNIEIFEALDCSSEYFKSLVLSRRSVRNYRPDPVPDEIIESAIKSAMYSPSACNRQPWTVFLYSDDEKKKILLKYQNGNKGFGHLAPQIAMITADERCFFDASERHEPYIDGGLFSMSFALALKANGVSTCCLNWCVPVSIDKTVHSLFNIPPSKKIIMLMAIGYATSDCMVPRSPRRKIEEVLIRM